MNNKEVVKDIAENLTIKEYAILSFIYNFQFSIQNESSLTKEFLIKEGVFDDYALESLLNNRLVAYGLIHPERIYPSPDLKPILDYAKVLITSHS